MRASRQAIVSSVRRDAWVEVDLCAIEDNVRVIKTWLESAPRFLSDRPDSKSRNELVVPPKLMAVVKSDAYGHGAQGVANVLTGAGAEWLAVASVDEGCYLRSIDKKTPILILGPAPSWAIETALEYDLDQTVVSAAQLNDIASVADARKKTARVHLKIDTGMHRLGAPPEALLSLVQLVRAHSNLHLAGIFSHLARADEEEFTRTQDNRFRTALASVSELFPNLLYASGGEVLTHLASGQAARRFPFTLHDMARVGLSLYGLEPDSLSDITYPALSVRGRVNQIKELAAGEALGYNLTWSKGEDSRIASIPVGYADGIDRGLSNRMSGLLCGKEVKQVGTISMDQMMFDITNVPQAQVGDTITLIGSDGGATLHLATWANLLDTITYELACRLRIRLPRVYTRHPQQSKSN